MTGHGLRVGQASYVGILNVVSKFRRLPGISRSDGRGQDLHNKLRLAQALTLQIRPFKRFGLNF